MFLTAWLLWCLLLVEIYSSLKTCLTDNFFPQQDQGLLIFYFTLFFPKKVSQNACIFSNIGSQVCSIFQSDSLLETILCSTRNKVYRASFIILMLLNVTPLVISYLEFKTFVRLTIIVHKSISLLLLDSEGSSMIMKGRIASSSMVTLTKKCFVVGYQKLQEMADYMW